MDQIFKGIIESPHPEGLKRILTNAMVDQSSTDVVAPQCFSLLNYSLEIASTSEKKINQELANMVFVTYGKHHPDILTEVLVPSKVEQLLLDPIHCNKTVFLNMLRQCLSSISNPLSQLNICRIVRKHCNSLLKNEPTLEMAKALSFVMLEFHECTPHHNDDAASFASHMVIIAMNVELDWLSFSNWPSSTYFDIILVVQLFKHLWFNMNTSEQLEVLRAIFNSAVQNPSVVLGAFIPNIPFDMIKNILSTLLQVADCQLQSFTVCLLGGVSWPASVSDNVSWVQSFLVELNSSGKVELVISVLESKLEELLKICMITPDPLSVFGLLKFGLLTCQHSQGVFHDIIRNIPRMISVVLAKLDTDEKRLNFKYEIAEVMYALMKLHSGFSDLYEPIQTCLKYFPSSRLFSSLVLQAAVQENRMSLYCSATDILYPVCRARNGGVPQSSESHLDALLTQYDPCLPLHERNDATCVPIQTVAAKTGRTGIDNEGNTCYVNCIVQALYMTNKFCVSVLKAKPQRQQPLLKKLQEVFGFLTHSQRDSIKINEFAKLSRLPWSDLGRQHDCSEFLRHLLDTLHEQEKILQEMEVSNPGVSSSEELLRTDFIPLKSETSMMDVSNPGQMSLCSSDVAMLVSNGVSQVSNESIETCRTGVNCNSSLKTLVEDTFGGKMVTTYRCSVCNSVSEKEETFIDLNLSFPEKTNEPVDDEPDLTLEDLVNLYFKPEMLDGDNSYSCEICKQLTTAERTTRIIKTPKFLILTLLRFSYDAQTHQHSKIFTDVHYPQMLHFPVNSEGQVLCGDEAIPAKKPAPCYNHDVISQHSFNLYAVVIHSGISSESGHYYTYGKSSLNLQVNVIGDDQMEVLNDNDQNMWYQLNDNSVSHSSYSAFSKLTKKFKKDTAYILFYQRAPDNPADGLPTDQDPAQVILSPDLYGKIERDNRRYQEEQSKLVKQSCFAPLNKRHEDDNPPSSCGGGGFQSNFSRYVC